MERTMKKGKTVQQHHTDQGDTQKQKLVDAAFTIIAELGFEGLHTRNIAARGGISVSTFHFYFPSKEDIVQAVAWKLLQEFKTQLNSEQQNHAGLNRIKSAVKDQAELMKKNKTLYIVVSEFFSKAMRDKKIRNIMKDLVEAWEQLFISAAMSGTGVLKPVKDPDLELRGKALHCLFWGMTMNQLLDREYPSLAIFQLVRQLMNS
jgi:AcrR family transcriptional regulator